ncbi:MAG: PPK2 family polyphosphate kinase [Bacteroidota bacterium]
MKRDYIYYPDNTKFKELKSESTAGFKSKEQAISVLEENKQKISEMQDILYADSKHALLIILQGMDASGKDGIIKHVMSGVNPQGFQIKSFGTPSPEEFKHDFLWRCNKEMPERGHIGIFNRSYYEETLIARVHPELLSKQFLPFIPENPKKDMEFWKMRFTDINNFEKYMNNNGFHILKFYLNISKEEQKKRLLKRINYSPKNWKFKFDDISERQHWNEYMSYYEDMFTATSTDNAPWHIIPADKKLYSRTIISQIILKKLESLNLKYPEASYKQKRGIIEARHFLDNEK